MKRLNLQRGDPARTSLKNVANCTAIVPGALDFKLWQRVTLSYAEDIPTVTRFRPRSTHVSALKIFNFQAIAHSEYVKPLALGARGGRHPITTGEFALASIELGLPRIESIPLGHGYGRKKQ
jgi:hypothetical protein